jgi:trehalose 6-phosphate synthase
MSNDNQTNPLIVIASNRGPFSFEAREDGGYRVRRGSGGLVTALSALAQKHDVLWVASAMSDSDRQWAEEQSDQIEEVEGIYLQLIIHNEEHYQRYYNTISNPLLWFIQHQLWDIPRSPTITRQTWDAWENGYRPINKGFAEAIASSLAGQDPARPVVIFVQDYHLYLVPHYLRDIVGERVQIQPFIHIPWPGPDAWRILPAAIRTPMLASLLQSDRIGFQTEKDAFNFVQTCRFYLPGAHSHGSRNSIEYQGRLVKTHAYPISVDAEKVKELAQEPQTQLLKSQLINFISDRRLILRVDRIEPSKNILRGLEAYRTLLEVYPEHQGKVQMLALLVPSRMEVDEYQDYLQQIMAKAGMINAEFSDAFWEPVRIVVGDNYHRAIGAMQFYDALLVNPIADGMNLVAKEGVLVNQRDGVLLLSEHAGAFYELGEQAITVSSFDVYGTAQAMNQALTMPAAERQERAEALRAIVEQADVRRWFYDQLEDALDVKREE